MSQDLTSSLIASLSLPPGARVEKRVHKKLFLEHGAPTSGDKRTLQDGIEEVVWNAALKASNVGVPSFQDETREYLEIAVLSVILRPKARTTRLIELIHRSIPYPLVLTSVLGEEVIFSLAHKRTSESEKAKFVLEGGVVSASFPSVIPESEVDFLASLKISRQPSTHLFALYSGWVEKVEALAAARLTGAFVPPASPEVAVARRNALADRARLAREIAGLRAQARKETQMNRRVELNLTIQRLESELTATTAAL